MWYVDVVCQLNKGQAYTRKQIYEALVNEKAELTYNSFKWILSEMVEEGVVCRKQRGEYVLGGNEIADKHTYISSMNEKLHEISMMLETKFPSVKFACFESTQLNEFVNHLIGRNTYFVLVERDSIDFVFRYLQDETPWNILLKPNGKEWDAYCTDNTIVLLNLVSEAPRSVGTYHGMCIEQMLVDIVAEKTFRYLYSKDELEGIYKRAAEAYLIDYVKLFRYARRRNKEDIVKKYIGGY